MTLPAAAQLWLIRHGETEWSRSGQHTGRTDLPLTELGEEQARAVTGLLPPLTPALVLSSPRQRATRTAELAGFRIDDTDEDLTEWDYGEYEGLTTPEIRTSDPGWTIWTGVTPGGETADEICRRVDRALDRARRALADGPVLLFAHGHLSRVLAARWIGLGASEGGRFTLGTAAPSLLGAEHGTPVIVRWNIPNPVGDT